MVFFREQTLIRGARCLPMEKFTSKNFYLILLNKISETPTAQAYMERNLPGVWTNIWPKIYLNVRKFTLDGFSRDLIFITS